MRKTIHGEEHPYNSDPEDYAANLCREVSRITAEDHTPSKRVVMALQAAMPNVMTAGFKAKVLDAITEDACEGKSKEWRSKYLRRLKRWTGPDYQQHFNNQFEILASWRERFPIVPDAYLIDAQKKTVVCFEVEDQHHLKLVKVEHYGGAWWCLEYIYWDLHLIAYDIYGNPRVIELPESSLTAKNLLDYRETRQGKKAQKNADDD